MAFKQLFSHSSPVLSSVKGLRVYNQLCVCMFSSKAPKLFVKRNKAIEPTDLALTHFDSFYAKVYDNQWPSIRLGLLSPNKYAAVVNNHCSDSDWIEAKLRQAGASDIQYVYAKNMKRILKNIEQKKLLEMKREKAHQDELSKPVNVMPPIIPDGSIQSPTAENFLNSTASSTESELDESLFFSASEGNSNEDTFVNAATMDLNLNNFVPVSDLNYQEAVINDKEYYQFYDMATEVPIEMVEQNYLKYPLNLHLFTYPRNDFSTFNSPSLSKSNLYNYYLLDAASALPTLILDIEDGHYVADLCAAPGGKSLLMHMMMYDCRFFLNEMSNSRFRRLQKVFSQFVPSTNLSNRIEFSNMDATKLVMYNMFDRVLVDVPCTNDRHSLYENDNNIFAKKRISERVKIPNQQMELLLAGMRSVKPGGILVYSTCSLSPIQNDGVIHMALNHCATHYSMSFKVVQLKEALRPLRSLFTFSHQFKYGTQVLPHMSSNFGPMYFAKLIRIQ